MFLGYARVSTKDQHLEMQIDALVKAGVDSRNIFMEKASGKNTERPELKKLLDYAKEGDTIVVFKLDRISRSVKDMLELMTEFEKRGIHFISIQDSIDTSNAMGRFFFKVIASIAELEREIIVERTMSGLEAAKARGNFGGRPKTDNTKLEMAYEQYTSGKYTVKEICNSLNLTRSVFYRYVDERKASAN
jgi:DNA invertase Pin-like site-specific DNA recombinase